MRGGRLGGLLLGALAVLFIGCVAHEAAGDKAAAVGDWRRALIEYRSAVEKKPDSQELKAKYASARAQALQDALGKARACMTSRRYACTIDEATYALALDRSNETALGLKEQAGVEWARVEMSDAERLFSTGDFAGGFDLLQKAMGRTADESIQEEAARIIGIQEPAAFEHVGRLRERGVAAGVDGLGPLDEALAMLDVMARLGREAAPVIAKEIRAERTELIEREHGRLVKEGIVAADSDRWSEASAALAKAEKLKPGAGFAEREVFAATMAESIRKAENGEHVEALALAEKAREMGGPWVERARAHLSRVTPTPWRVRIRSLIVEPVRPDGRPWAGTPNNRFSRTAGRVRAGLAAALALIDGGMDVGGEITRTVATLPPANIPNLLVEMTLPDGRVVRSEARKGLYVSFDASFVMLTNHYDKRNVEVRVLHAELGRPDVDVAAVGLELAQLVRGQAVPSGRSLLWMDVAAIPESNALDGTLDGLDVVRRSDFDFDAVSRPVRGSVGYRLETVAVKLGATDKATGSLAGVDLEQGGRLLFRAPPIPGKDQASWTPPALYVFVRPDENLIVRLHRSQSGPQSWEVKGSELAGGKLVLPTLGGGEIELRVVPRTWP